MGGRLTGNSVPARRDGTPGTRGWGGISRGSTLTMGSNIIQELCESRGERPGLSVLTGEPSGFRGRKDLLNRASALVTTCP